MDVNSKHEIQILNICTTTYYYNNKSRMYNAYTVTTNTDHTCIDYCEIQANHFQLTHKIAY